VFKIPTIFTEEFEQISDQRHQLLEAAYQRRRLDRIEEAIKLLSKS